MAEGRSAPGVEGPVVPDEVGRIFRAESGRCVAALIRMFGDIDIAEDAVQEAFAAALRHWPVDGLPPNPGGWITTVARNKAIDGLRRSARERQLLDQADRFRSGAIELDAPEEMDPVQDDRLRLIFTCCHPALAPEAQIALTLRLIGGLRTGEVAAALLVPEATMAKRISRAKHKIKVAHVPYRVPEDDELPARLPPVLAVEYLIYNAGLDRRDDSVLCAEAIRLARLLAGLMPDEPEVAGLLALMLLSEARRTSRTAPDGSVVLLADQDRSRWDRELIAEGHAIVRACLRHGRPGPYQIQAAISAVHTDAQTFAGTDWTQILALYDMLLAAAPTPVVALNRAIAVGELDGPAAALALVDELDLEGYYALHATRANLLKRLGRTGEAAEAYGRAAELAPTSAEREFYRSRGRSGARLDRARPGPAGRSAGLAHSVEGRVHSHRRGGD